MWTLRHDVEQLIVHLFRSSRNNEKTSDEDILGKRAVMYVFPHSVQRRVFTESQVLS